TVFHYSANVENYGSLPQAKNTIEADSSTGFIREPLVLRKAKYEVENYQALSFVALRAGRSGCLAF
ncbi:MAG: hypothetical protein ACRD82_21705, partial [Blastocatellia bacterium]